MCNVGDIIIIKKFKNEFNRDVAKHPFIVIEEDGGEILGMSFDFIALLLSSFKDEKHKNRKLSYLANIEINQSEGVLKDSFAKGNQLYYFARNNIEYFVVGKINEEALERVREELEEILKNNLAVKIVENLEL